MPQNKSSPTSKEQFKKKYGKNLARQFYEDVDMRKVPNHEKEERFLKWFEGFKKEVTSFSEKASEQELETVRKDLRETLGQVPKKTEKIRKEIKELLEGLDKDKKVLKLPASPYISLDINGEKTDFEKEVVSIIPPGIDKENVRKLNQASEKIALEIIASGVGTLLLPEINADSSDKQTRIKIGFKLFDPKISEEFDFKLVKGTKILNDLEVIIKKGRAEAEILSSGEKIKSGEEGSNITLFFQQRIMKEGRIIFFARNPGKIIVNLSKIKSEETTEPNQPPPGAGVAELKQEISTEEEFEEYKKKVREKLGGELVPATSEPLFGQTVEFLVEIKEGKNVVENAMIVIDSLRQSIDTAASTKKYQQYFLTITKKFVELMDSQGLGKLGEENARRIIENLRSLRDSFKSELGDSRAMIEGLLQRLNKEYQEKFGKEESKKPEETTPLRTTRPAGQGTRQTRATPQPATTGFGQDLKSLTEGQVKEFLERVKKKLGELEGQVKKVGELLEKPGELEEKVKELDLQAMNLAHAIISINRIGEMDKRILKKSKKQLKRLVKINLKLTNDLLDEYKKFGKKGVPGKLKKLVKENKIEEITLLTSTLPNTIWRRIEYMTRLLPGILEQGNYLNLIPGGEKFRKHLEEEYNKAWKIRGEYLETREKVLEKLPTNFNQLVSAYSQLNDESSRIKTVVEGLHYFKRQRKNLAKKFTQLITQGTQSLTRIQSFRLPEEDVKPRFEKHNKSFMDETLDKAGWDKLVKDLSAQDANHVISVLEQYTRGVRHEESREHNEEVINELKKMWGEARPKKPPTPPKEEELTAREPEGKKFQPPQLPEPRRVNWRELLRTLSQVNTELGRKNLLGAQQVMTAVQHLSGILMVENPQEILLALQNLERSVETLANTIEKRGENEEAAEKLREFSAEKLVKKIGEYDLSQEDVDEFASHVEDTLLKGVEKIKPIIPEPSWAPLPEPRGDKREGEVITTSQPQPVGQPGEGKSPSRPALIENTKNKIKEFKEEDDLSKKTDLAKQVIDFLYEILNEIKKEVGDDEVIKQFKKLNKEFFKSSGFGPMKNEGLRELVKRMVENKEDQEVKRLAVVLKMKLRMYAEQLRVIRIFEKSQLREDTQEMIRILGEIKNQPSSPLGGRGEELMRTRPEVKYPEDPAKQTPMKSEPSWAPLPEPRGDKREGEVITTRRPRRTRSEEKRKRAFKIDASELYEKLNETIPVIREFKRKAIINPGALDFLDQSLQQLAIVISKGEITEQNAQVFAARLTELRNMSGRLYQEMNQKPQLKEYDSAKNVLRALQLIRDTRFRLNQESINALTDYVKGLHFDLSKFLEEWKPPEKGETITTRQARQFGRRGEERRLVSLPKKEKPPALPEPESNLNTDEFKKAWSELQEMLGTLILIAGDLSQKIPHYERPVLKTFLESLGEAQKQVIHGVNNRIQLVPLSNALKRVVTQIPQVTSALTKYVEDKNAAERLVKDSKKILEQEDKYDLRNVFNKGELTPEYVEDLVDELEHDVGAVISSLIEELEESGRTRKQVGEAPVRQLFDNAKRLVKEFKDETDLEEKVDYSRTVFQRLVELVGLIRSKDQASGFTSLNNEFLETETRMLRSDKEGFKDFIKKLAEKKKVEEIREVLTLSEGFTQTLQNTILETGIQLDQVLARWRKLIKFLEQLLKSLGETHRPPTSPGGGAGREEFIIFQSYLKEAKQAIKKFRSTKEYSQKLKSFQQALKWLLSLSNQALRVEENRRGRALNQFHDLNELLNKQEGRIRKKGRLKKWVEKLSDDQRSQVINELRKYAQELDEQKHQRTRQYWEGFLHDVGAPGPGEARPGAEPRAPEPRGRSFEALNQEVKDLIDQFRKESDQSKKLSTAFTILQNLTQMANQLSGDNKKVKELKKRNEDFLESGFRKTGFKEFVMEALPTLGASTNELETSIREYAQTLMDSGLENLAKPYSTILAKISAIPTRPEKLRLPETTTLERVSLPKPSGPGAAMDNLKKVPGLLRQELFIQPSQTINEFTQQAISVVNSAGESVGEYIRVRETLITLRALIKAYLDKMKDNAKNGFKDTVKDLNKESGGRVRDRNRPELVRNVLQTIIHDDFLQKMLRTKTSKDETKYYLNENAYKVWEESFNVLKNVDKNLEKRIEFIDALVNKGKTGLEKRPILNDLKRMKESTHSLTQITNKFLNHMIQEINSITSAQLNALIAGGDKSGAQNQNQYATLATLVKIHELAFAAAKSLEKYVDKEVKKKKDFYKEFEKQFEKTVKKRTDKQKPGLALNYAKKLIRQLSLPKTARDELILLLEKASGNKEADKRLENKAKYEEQRMENIREGIEKAYEELRDYTKNKKAYEGFPLGKVGIKCSQGHLIMALTPANYYLSRRYCLQGHPA